MLLRKTFRFEASHVLPMHPGKCSRLHGHSWVLHVFVEGSVNPETGFVMDYTDITAVVKPLIDQWLDHRHLNDMPIYPSSENLLYWIGTQLKPPERPYTASSEINVLWMGLNWSKLALEETCTSYAELTREEFDATHH